MRLLKYCITISVTTLYNSSLNIAALIVKAIINQGVPVAEGHEDASANAGDTETPLTISLRGSFKLDNNDCLWPACKKGNSYSIRHISRFRPNYFPASGGGVSIGEQ